MKGKGFFLKHSPNGVWYGVFDSLSGKNLKHGISTRLGGCSQAPYKSLNLGFNVADVEENVRKNRNLFSSAVGFDAEKTVAAKQVHGDKIRIVTENDIGKGANSFDSAISDTDALITNVQGIPLMLFFADCVPIIIYDSVNRAVGLSHAGWRGTVANIAEKTLSMMKTKYNTNPKYCLAAIGPSIGPCCYEVDELVIDKLRDSFKEELTPEVFASLVVAQGKKRRLNLWETNRLKLKRSGIPAEQIEVSSVCTSCNTSLYFSYRAENGKTGRIGAVVCL